MTLDHLAASPSRIARKPATRVKHADGRKGTLEGNRVRLDTGEIVDADGFMVVWPSLGHVGYLSNRWPEQGSGGGV